MVLSPATPSLGDPVTSAVAQHSPGPPQAQTATTLHLGDGGDPVLAPSAPPSWGGVVGEVPGEGEGSTRQ